MSSSATTTTTTTTTSNETATRAYVTLCDQCGRRITLECVGEAMRVPGGALFLCCGHAYHWLCGLAMANHSGPCVKCVPPSSSAAGHPPPPQQQQQQQAVTFAASDLLRAAEIRYVPDLATQILRAGDGACAMIARECLTATFFADNKPVLACLLDLLAGRVKAGAGAGANAKPLNLPGDVGANFPLALLLAAPTLNFVMMVELGLTVAHLLAAAAAPGVRLIDFFAAPAAVFVWTQLALLPEFAIGAPRYGRCTTAFIVDELRVTRGEDLRAIGMTFDAALAAGMTRADLLRWRWPLASCLTMGLTAAHVRDWLRPDANTYRTLGWTPEEVANKLQLTAATTTTVVIGNGD